MTSLFGNGLLKKAIVHPTQFLGFEFISTQKLLLFSNENFQSIEKYLNLQHTRVVVEVDSSPWFKICFFQVSIRHFFIIMLKDVWNTRLMSELVFICFNNYYLCCSIKLRTIYCVLIIFYKEARRYSLEEVCF